jgi:hypothetical protein
MLQGLIGGVEDLILKKKSQPQNFVVCSFCLGDVIYRCLDDVRWVGLG